MTRGRASYPITKLMSPEVAKWVTVNVNGNAHHELRILISPYTVRQFENLLSHLTEKLKPPFGAVWHLFTETGIEIKDLDDIKGGGTYIASGRAKPPMFVARARSGRSRRDDGPPQAREQRELRSHSAVGSLGGSGGGGGPRVGPRRGPDTSSDTNVPGPAAPSRPSRPAPAPRRAKARSGGSSRAEDQQVWDRPLHNQQQCQYHQQLPNKRKQSVNKPYEEDSSCDEEVERAEGISIKPNLRSANY